MKKEVRYEVRQKMHGKTIQQFLREEVLLTNAQIRSLKFRENGILKNGKRARVTELVEQHDVLQLLLETEECASGHLVPVKRELSILYEDDDVICLWKDRGIPVHPAGVHFQDSLSNNLAWYFEERNMKVQIRSIGRLDLETSGIMVFAKNGVAAARLWKQKEEGIFQKEYLALCEGSFLQKCYQEDQSIELKIGKKDAYSMCIDPKGKEAYTSYRAVRELVLGEKKATLLRVRIKTGRMHQIRVHMAAIDHPLIGDGVYGNGTRGKSYAQLSAVRVVFIQPFTGARVELCYGLEKILDENKQV